MSVAIPYARNVLLAQGKAKVADKQAIETMKQKQEKHAKHEAESASTFARVQERAAQVGSLKIQKKSTPNGHLYEKVSVKEIQAALAAASQITVDPERIHIDGKIEAIGETSVNILYKGKKVKVPVTVM